MQEVKIKHLTALSDLSLSDIFSILENSRFYFQNPTKTPNYHTKTIAHLFFEDSTRTRVSFELAAKRLNIISTSMDLSSSSLNKGESIFDTIETLKALNVDILTLRHKSDDLIYKIKELGISIVNSGSGTTGHPTQALLDACVMMQEFKEIKDKKILICGDINNSRVAASNIELLKRLGAKLMLSSIEELKDEYQDLKNYSLDEAITQCDAAMFLRVQHERHKNKFDIDDYNKNFGLNLDRLNKMKDNAIFMHPGPVNWGVELHDEIKSHAKSRILKQVTMGLFTRVAVLDWILKDNK